MSWVYLQVFDVRDVQLSFTSTPCMHRHPEHPELSGHQKPTDSLTASLTRCTDGKYSGSPTNGNGVS